MTLGFCLFKYVTAFRVGFFRQTEAEGKSWLGFLHKMCILHYDLKTDEDAGVDED